MLSAKNQLPNGKAWTNLPIRVGALLLFVHLAVVLASQFTGYFTMLRPVSALAVIPALIIVSVGMTRAINVNDFRSLAVGVIAVLLGAFSFFDAIAANPGFPFVNIIYLVKGLSLLLIFPLRAAGKLWILIDGLAK